ncbi:MAG: SH3 domain-containing protein [Planctomycetota bacterium]
MRSYINLFIFIVLSGLVSTGFAQEAAGGSGTTNEAGVPSFPYLAEIAGDNVYIRSGPGTNFYHCGKLNKSDKVKVVGKQFSWSRIVPPAGSFSWISMQYVRIESGAPGVGTVTGDSVRVYAGSDFVKPMHSTTLQGKLNKGEKVKLLGEQMDDYYKIASPAFAYLWVSTNFTKPLPPVADIPPPVKPVVKPKVEPNDTKVVVPTQVSPPMTKLEEYRALQKQLQAERAKPVDQQDYTSIKKALTNIANDEGAGRAARYAKFVLRQIEGFELALAVSKTVQLQNEQLEKIKAGIEKARATRLAEVENLGRFAAVGQFQTYETYGPGNYRIVDESGKMVCYALPAGQASQMDLSKLVGRRVGIAGTIEPHRPTKKALVQFSEIVELK